VLGTNAAQTPPHRSVSVRRAQCSACAEPSPEGALLWRVCATMLQSNAGGSLRAPCGQAKKLSTNSHVDGRHRSKPVGRSVDQGVSLWRLR